MSKTSVCVCMWVRAQIGNILNRKIYSRMGYTYLLDHIYMKFRFYFESSQLNKYFICWCVDFLWFFFCILCVAIFDCIFFFQLTVSIACSLAQLCGFICFAFDSVLCNVKVDVRIMPLAQSCQPEAIVLLNFKLFLVCFARVSKEII